MVATVGSISIDLATNAVNFASGFRKSASTVDRESARMAKSVRVVDTSMKSLLRTAVGLTASALGARQIANYADAWTEAGNKIRAAGEISGQSFRSLGEINEIAKGTRSGLVETVDLYAKLLRATAGVAKSELEVASATEILNKAFKAGGASAGEQAAGILQLSQALGSGVLQGDELRSIRENAPLLAKAIADEYKTNIAGLKALGAEGKITSERVFKAILQSKDSIDAAFSQTNQTVGESFTILKNELIESIGLLDQGAGFSQKFANGINNLAEEINGLQEKGGFFDFVLEGLNLKRDDNGPAEQFRDITTEMRAESSRTVEAIIADMVRINQKVVELQADVLGGLFNESAIERERAEIAALTAELVSVGNAATAAGNALRSAFAEQFRAAENASMAALAALNPGNTLPKVTGGGGDGRFGVIRNADTLSEELINGVNVIGGGVDETTESTDRINDSIGDLDRNNQRYFDQLGSTIGQGFGGLGQTINAASLIEAEAILEAMGLSLMDANIQYDGANLGLGPTFFGNPRSENQQYTISTPSQSGQSGGVAYGEKAPAPGVVLNYQAAQGETEKTSRQNARTLWTQLNREMARS